MFKQKGHNPCSDLSSDQLDILREISKLQMGQGLDYDSKIMDRARDRAKKRFKNAQEQREIVKEKLEETEVKQMHKAVEQLLNSDKDIEDILTILQESEQSASFRKEIEKLEMETQSLTQKDFEEVLSEFSQKGLAERGKPQLNLTSRGAQLLGRGVLSRILQRLARQGVGPHRIEDVGHGPWIASTIRPYETGDPYERISIEKSFLATLEKGTRIDKFSIEDFRVFEAIHSTEVVVGILVDLSASMNRGGKLEAAVETAIALSELMRSEYPEDRLRIYAFSEEIKEVEHWELPQIPVPMGYTDIRKALKTFRLAVAHEAGNKQAHIITDSAPNFEDGEYIGFEKGLQGVINEARKYRASGIVLNLVMLDEDPKLKKMAKAIASQNIGRVFFTKSRELGEAIVEDYILSKREYLRF